MAEMERVLHWHAAVDGSLGGKGYSAFTEHRKQRQTEQLDRMMELIRHGLRR